MIICLWCSIQHNKNNKIKNNLAEAKRRRGPKSGHLYIYIHIYMCAEPYLSIRKTSRTTPSRPIIPYNQYRPSPYRTTTYHHHPFASRIYFLFLIILNSCLLRSRMYVRCACMSYYNIPYLSIYKELPLRFELGEINNSFGVKCGEERRRYTFFFILFALVFIIYTHNTHTIRKCSKW